jgi:hypothetical protein
MDAIESIAQSGGRRDVDERERKTQGIVDDQYLLFVPGGGNPQNDRYSAARGGRGSRMTLPKVHSLDARPVAAYMALRGATAQAIFDWVISQLRCSS